MRMLVKCIYLAKTRKSTKNYYTTLLKVYKFSSIKEKS